MEIAIALLSGGIDSPVAIHLMQDRLDIIAAHFHQMPLTDEKEIEKVKQLVRVLELPKVYLVPFTPVLKSLVELCSHKQYFVLQKIAMMKAATLIAQKENAQYLITGENLGQVSSQTLSNLVSITTHVSLEIFRPLLTYDKEEITKVAKKIGTFDISKGPEICCLLGPKHPATKTDVADIGKELERLDPKIIEQCVANADVIIS